MVVQQVLSIHPTLGIRCKEGCHTDEFSEAAGTAHAFEQCLIGAKGVAPSAIGTMLDEVYDNRKRGFENMENDIGDCKAIFGNGAPSA